MSRLLVAVLLTIFMTGCASKYSMHPVEVECQKAIYCDGNEGVLSEKELSVVVFSPAQTNLTSSERPKLLFSIKNNGSEFIEISHESISATLDGEPVHVFSHEELLDEANRKAFWSKACLITCQVSSILCQYSAGHYDYNTCLQQQTANDTSQIKTLLLANEIEKDHDKALFYLSTDYLKRNTLAPGQCISGSVQINCLNPVEETNLLMVSLAAGPEQHEFLLELISKQANKPTNRRRLRNN